MKAPALVAALAVCACGARVEKSAPPIPAPAAAPVASLPAATPTPSRTKKPEKKVDPLFPKRAPRGWKDLTAAEREAAHKNADDYVPFLSAGKTPRRAIEALVRIAEESGARVAGDGESGLSGFHYAVEPNGEAAVFFRSGTLNSSAGLSVVVVSVDAPRLLLKQNAAQERHGFEVLQTKPHGDLELRTWMVHPMALDVFALSRGKPIHFTIGEDGADPILSIPDLLPHLSRGSQRRGREVTDPERLDPIGGAKSGALARLLRSRGLSMAELAAAEAVLVPAGEARRVGVDRALVGGYGQANRALAFAAVTGLVTASPARAALVVVIGRTEDGGDSGTGHAFVARAIRRTLAHLAERPMDVYETRVAMNRTAALVAQPGTRAQNTGVIVNVASADSLPVATRGLLAILRSAKVPYKLVDKSRSAAGRTIATLDLDTIGLSLPTNGHGTPGETISVLDLNHGVHACRAWFSRSQ